MRACIGFVCCAAETQKCEILLSRFVWRSADDRILPFLLALVYSWYEHVRFRSQNEEESRAIVWSESACLMWNCRLSGRTLITDELASIVLPFNNYFYFFPLNLVRKISSRLFAFIFTSCLFLTLLFDSADDNSKNVLAQHLITSETNHASMGDMSEIVNFDTETLCIKFNLATGKKREQRKSNFCFGPNLHFAHFSL